MATLEQEKVVTEELIERLKTSDAVYLTDYSGMTVAEINNLRKVLRKEGITYTVYKNKLVKRAMDEIGGYDNVYHLLVDQTAYAFASGDPAIPAKVLKKYLKDKKKPSFKAAFIEGALFDAEKLDMLSAMKSKEEVIGDIIGLLLSPIQNIVGGLQAQGSNILGAVKTISEKPE
jgi:large subunit ribosomal protein L10